MTTNPPEGWYTDPHDATGLRYWDGATWTEHTHSADGAGEATAAATPPASDPVTAPAQSTQPEYAAPAFAAPLPGVQSTEAAPAQPTGSYGLSSNPSQEATKSGLGKGAIIGIGVAALVVLLAIIGIIVIALNAGNDDKKDDAKGDDPEIVASATAAPDDTTDETPAAEEPTDEEPADEEPAGAATVPDGWESVDSPSGAITYAHAPGMTDGGELIDLSTLEGQLSSSLPGATAEISGMWIDMSATSAAGTTIMLMTTDGAVETGNLAGELEAFAGSASGGAEGLEVSDTEEFKTAAGYDAATLNFSVESGGASSYSTVTAVVKDGTTVFVFATSVADEDTGTTIGRQTADSLVINHAP